MRPSCPFPPVSERVVTRVVSRFVSRFVTASAALALATAAPALAAPKKPKPAAETRPTPAEEAAKLKAQGDAAFDAFLYEDALRAYEQSYELSHDPALSFNRGRALQALGRYPEALEMFERFEREAPASLLAKVPGLAQLIEDVRARVATLEVTCDVAGAQVIVGDRVLGETGALGKVRLNAGPSTIKVQREGYFPVRRDVKLEGGRTLSLDVKLVSRATAGVLAIVVDPSAARVSIDGRFQGQSPLELVLPAGTHEVAVQSPGYEPLTSKAVVRADGRVDVRLTLHPTPALTSRWWFWTGVGAVVITGVAVGVALTTNRSPPSGDFSPGRVTAPLFQF